MQGYHNNTLEEVLSVASRAGHKMEDAMATLDRRTITPIALGAMASMAVGALLGDEGYSRKPLDMGSNYSDARVNQMIGQGNLFSQSGAMAPVSEEFGPGGSRFAQMSANINVPQTYMAAGNSYQVRGTMNGVDALPSMSRLIGSMSGMSGSLRVNDNRTPITPAYSNRLMGEY